MVAFTVIGILVVGAFVATLAYAGYWYFSGNIRVLDNGNLIRSAQLSKRQLKKLLKKYKPKTVVSFRGEAHFRTGKEKGESERTVVEEFGSRYAPISMSSQRFPYPEDLNKLLDVYMDLGSYPIYIHCLGGADRTGEASAIYSMMIMKKSQKEALKQLTFRYLHIAGLKPAKRYFIQEWKGIDWARKKYRRFE